MCKKGATTAHIDNVRMYFDIFVKVNINNKVINILLYYGLQRIHIEWYGGPVLMRVYIYTFVPIYFLSVIDIKVDINIVQGYFINSNPIYANFFASHLFEWRFSDFD